MRVARSPLRTGRLYPQEYPGHMDFGKISPVTRPGIDPGAFRLVEQRLNHYTTPPFARRVAKINLYKCVLLLSSQFVSSLSTFEPSHFLFFSASIHGHKCLFRPRAFFPTLLVSSLNTLSFDSLF